MNHINHHNKVEGTQAQARGFSFQTCKVTYGGVDGAYYTSTRTRRADNDGVRTFSVIVDSLLDFLSLTL